MTTTCEPELVLSGDARIQEQIEEQLRGHITAGRLLPGEQLPTVRGVAVQLAVNPDAVRRAYERLVRDGWLTDEDGSGTFVAPAGQIARVAADRRVALERLCEQFLAAACDQGFTAADVLRTAEAIWQRSQ